MAAYPPTPKQKFNTPKPKTLGAVARPPKSGPPSVKPKAPHIYTDAELAAMTSGNRSRISTSQLTPLYKQKRKAAVERRQPFLGALAYPGSPTNEDINQAQKAAVQTQFGPQEQAIQQTQANIPVWYQNYLNQINGLQAQVASQYAPINAAASSLGAAQTPPTDANTPEAQAAAVQRAKVADALRASLLGSQGAQAGLV